MLRKSNLVFALSGTERWVNLPFFKQHSPECAVLEGVVAMTIDGETVEKTLNTEMLLYVYRIRE